MKEIFCPYYFSLEAFEFSALWKKEDHVWKALVFLAEGFPFLTKGRQKMQLPSHVYFDQEETIFIGEGCTIEPGAYIRGPCIIGNECVIRHNAYLRGNVIAGDRCVIGHGTEIKDSILLHDVHAAHFSYIGNSILGNKVNLGAGVKCANFRLDQAEISLRVGSERVHTGQRKLGAIIGDRTQIGCNCVLNPGTLMGQDSLCYPLLNIGGFIPSGSIVNQKNWERQWKK